MLWTSSSGVLRFGGRLSIGCASWRYIDGRRPAVGIWDSVWLQRGGWSRWRWCRMDRRTWKAAHDCRTVCPPKAQSRLHGKTTSRLLSHLGGSRLSGSRCLAHETPDNVDKAGKTTLHKDEYVVLKRSYACIQFSLVRGEEWLEVVLIDECWALQKLFSPHIR